MKIEAKFFVMFCGLAAIVLYSAIFWSALFSAEVERLVIERGGDSNAMLNKSNELRAIVSVVAVSFIVAIIFSALLLLRQSILRPLMQLKDAATKISKGNLDNSINVTSSDEIGALASSFETMRKNVLETNMNLNRTVEIRTKELERANKELEVKDRLKDEFICIASHELRTPIQPILGFAYLSREGQIDQQEAWDGVIRNARRLQQLTNNILEVSRIDSGNFTRNMEKVRINDVIDGLIKATKASLGKDVSIITKLGKDVAIDADTTLITQLLTNIVSNAVKFTQQGSINVETSVSLEKNKIEIEISDTGCGIPEDDLPHIFDKFVARSFGNETPHGTGLGLYISRAIVIAHKGEISAYNNDEGGATFTIKLPIESNKPYTKVRRREN